MHNYCHCPEVAESRHSNHFGNFQGSVGLIRLIFLKHQSPCYKLRDNIKRTMARPYVTIEFRFKTSAATSLGNQPQPLQQLAQNGEGLPGSLYSAPCFQLRTNQEKQSMCSSQSPKIPHFWLAQVLLPHTNNLQSEDTLTLPFFRYKGFPLPCLPLGWPDTRDNG